MLSAFCISTRFSQGFAAILLAELKIEFHDGSSPGSKATWEVGLVPRGQLAKTLWLSR